MMGFSLVSKNLSISQGHYFLLSLSLWELLGIAT